MSLNPTVAQALAPFAPANSSVHRDAINDDDLYVVDLRSKAVVERHSCKSVMADRANVYGMPVKPGQALVRGMQLRGML